MAARLPDDVRLSRLRENVRNASARRRDRLMMNGNQQLLVWIPSPLREQIDALTATQGKSLSVVTTELLTAALTPSKPVPEPVNSLPLFQSETALETTLTSDSDSRVDRDQQILELHRQGLKNTEIGRQFGLGESSIRRALQRVKA